MKTLILVRHAKSSWENPDISDFERPLNRRGLRDAPFMAKLLKKIDVKPDLIVSSPAIRALTTAKIFAKELDYSFEDILEKELIYSSGPQKILSMLVQMEDSISTIMMFGHNPDLSSLSHYLIDDDFGNLPTCGIVCIDFDVDSWSNINEEIGTLRYYESPKKYFKKDI